MTKKELIGWECGTCNKIIAKEDYPLVCPECDTGCGFWTAVWTIEGDDDLVGEDGYVKQKELVVGKKMTFKNYLAIYRDPEDSSRLRYKLTDEYSNMKNFKEDLRGNGYSVLTVLTEHAVKHLNSVSSYLDVKIAELERYSVETQKRIIIMIQNFDEIQKAFGLEG